VNSAVPPNFDGSIRESQPTMALREDIDYRSRDGYGANKVAAERVLLGSGHPVTVLRPSRVHGDGTSKPDEWVFVKRVLDRRRIIVLSRGGRGVDQTSAASNIAALTEVVASAPGMRILNSADPTRPARWRSRGPLPRIWVTGGGRYFSTSAHPQDSACIPGIGYRGSGST
jgi:nucleoside-diphosphate-sugar epimerase